jgi:hypothetical protein
MVGRRRNIYLKLEHLFYWFFFFYSFQFLFVLVPQQREDACIDVQKNSKYFSSELGLVI